MARLSGLASEHHPEGPGDTPRRKRGRPSKHPSSSQEPASTGKRTASPAESSQAKRTKHVQQQESDDEDLEQIADEMEQSFSRSQQGDTIRVDTQSSSSTAVRHNTRRHSDWPLNRVPAVQQDRAIIRRVRKSMPAQLGVERVDEEIDESQFQYAPLSAVLDGRTRRRLRRSHLSQEVNDIDHQKKADKKKLLELREQLRAQADKIKDLEFQLEARRMGEIDMTSETADAIEQELEDARDEIQALRASSLYNGSDRDLSIGAFDGAADLSDDDDGQLLLVEPDELNLSRDIDMIATPSGKYASRVQELSSQMTFESLHSVSQLVHDSLLDIEGDSAVPDKIEDQAVERYEQELRSYVRLLADSQGALRLVTLELQNLRFLDPGRSSSDILVELRHGFDTLRLEIEKLFPGATADLTNQELLHKIPELFGGIFFELKEKLTLISTSQKTELLLRRQYEGVLDLLAESEERVADLEQKEYNLDEANEEKQRTIVDLEEQVTTLTHLTDGQETDIKKKRTHITELEGEIDDKDTDLARLRTALDKYRQDLQTTTQTATTFEEEHHALIARMEDDHAKAIQALQADLDAEQQAREDAEGDAMQKGEYIEDLESRVQRLETELHSLTDDLTSLRDRLTQQTEARNEAEGQRDEQAEIAAENMTQVEDLSRTIAELRSQIAEFQKNLAAERTQREQTETELDEKIQNIEDLNQQIHTQGIQANELRSKLFQLQQEKEQTIKQLQEDAQEREDDLQDQLEKEKLARGVVEKTVTKLDKLIEQLQADLETTKIDLKDMTDARQLLEQDRERQVAALNQQLISLQAKYTALEGSSQSTIDALQADIIDLNNTVQRQQAEIKDLKQELAYQKTLYEEDTTMLKDQVAELEDDLAKERAENDKASREINSLSDRITRQGEDMLEANAAHIEESTTLRATIRTLEAAIQNHKDYAADYAAEYEETVSEYERKIEEQEAFGSAATEAVTILTSQLEDLKAKFAKQEEDTRVTVDALNMSHRRLLEENESLAARLKERNAATLKAVQDMKAANVVVKTQNTDLSKVRTGKVVKTTEKVKVGKKKGRKAAVEKSKSWRDSGMFEEVEDEDAKAGASQRQEVDEDFLAA